MRCVGIGQEPSQVLSGDLCHVAVVMLGREPGRQREAVAADLTDGVG